MSEATAPKKRRTRSSPKARPAYVILQVLDESGEPMKFDRSRIRMVGIERNPASMAEYVLTDNGVSNHLVFKVDVPASPNSRPALQAAA
jgi:hypothetical protein